jgi:hypothetical protein
LEADFLILHAKLTTIEQITAPGRLLLFGWRTSVFDQNRKALRFNQQPVPSKQKPTTETLVFSRQALPLPPQ